MQLPLSTPLATAISANLLSWWHGQPSPAQSSIIVERVLSRHPILDGHFDLPVIARVMYDNDISELPYESETFGQIDLPRLRQGHVGGFWSIAFVPCNVANDGNNFTTPSNQVRDTLEQIDVTRSLAAYFPKDVAVARTPAEHRANVKGGKVSHWIGVEGGHMLGNSLSVLRTFADLGVTYMTLTHTCHNAFADSCQPSEPLHRGLSGFGQRLVKELNRLGVAVDLSHTSPDTQRQAIELSAAPVVFSHSGAAAVLDHPRNIRDDVLYLLKDQKRDVAIGVPFVSDFVAGPGKSTLKDVVQHVEHIASILGRDKVAVGSDFDGAFEFANGLNDTSYFPNLFVELHQKGWSEKELAGLASENFLRVYEKIQSVGRTIRAGKTDLLALPDTKPWHGRNGSSFE